MTVETADGKTWGDAEELVGSVPKPRSRDIHTPARIGEFPVFVEQHGNFRMFTYTHRLVRV